VSHIVGECSAVKSDGARNGAYRLHKNEYTSISPFNTTDLLTPSVKNYTLND